MLFSCPTGRSDQTVQTDPYQTAPKNGQLNIICSNVKVDSLGVRELRTFHYLFATVHQEVMKAGFLLMRLIYIMITHPCNACNAPRIPILCSETGV